MPTHRAKKERLKRRPRVHTEKQKRGVKPKEKQKRGVKPKENLEEVIEEKV